MVIFIHSYSKMILCDSHEVSGSMGLRNVIEEHGMLFEKGFDKAGTRSCSHVSRMGMMAFLA